MLAVISQRLLVNQIAAADPAQPGQAGFDGMSGVQFANPGVAVLSCEKSGVLTSTHYVNWAAGVVQGQVSIEVADEPSYVGPWVVLATIDFVAGIVANSSNVVPIPGLGAAPRQDVLKIDGAFAAIRHRVSGMVVGGSVSTKVVATT